MAKNKLLKIAYAAIGISHNAQFRVLTVTDISHRCNGGIGDRRRQWENKVESVATHRSTRGPRLTL
ncbi:hypothetical protein BpHYR1_028724 [Brachionus plicatilis]|uniref:Uncharacterized protein n=1 Tax=Brachionus plicatilis TaxID=10195 RepID=A0A3M7T5F3_BRAPC|nr:hypothetical protein BpHYR1_028724 [Brachionus plicatilis]